MKVILLIINLVISLYGSAPIFVTGEALPEDRQGQGILPRKRHSGLRQQAEGGASEQTVC